MTIVLSRILRRRDPSICAMSKEHRPKIAFTDVKDYQKAAA
jgi:hypothetical protein